MDPSVPNFVISIGTGAEVVGQVAGERFRAWDY